LVELELELVTQLGNGHNAIAKNHIGCAHELPTSGPLVVVQRVSASVKAENFRFLDPGSLCSSPRDLFLAELSIAMFVVWVWRLALEIFSLWNNLFVLQNDLFGINNDHRPNDGQPWHRQKHMV
jgi:hypothetical protein